MRTRFAHLSEDERLETLADLRRTRDRVLDGGRVCEGDVFADVGAGTGLLTLGAVERVGADGDVLAIDISADALEELRHACSSANVAYLIGSADVLPLMSGSADVVATRSVLIYVANKRDAAREFFRVLRAGGRISVFEPINRRATRIWDVVDFGELRERVVEEFNREWPPDDPMHDFVEEDLVRVFREAGFAGVEVELDAVEQELTPTQMLTSVGAPGRRSLGDRWRDAFSPSEVEALEQAVHDSGSLTLRIPAAFVSGEKL